MSRTNIYIVSLTVLILILLSGIILMYFHFMPITSLLPAPEVSTTSEVKNLNLQIANKYGLVQYLEKQGFFESQGVNLQVNRVSVKEVVFNLVNTLQPDVLLADKKVGPYVSFGEGYSISNKKLIININISPVYIQKYGLKNVSSSVNVYILYHLYGLVHVLPSDTVSQSKLQKNLMMFKFFSLHP